MSTVLVVLTVIATVASTVAVWARTTLLETDRFVTVVEGALSDPSFPAALSEVVTDQVVAALDLDARVTATLEEFDELVVGSVLEAADLDPAVEDRLSRLGRPRLAALAPGIAAALESRVAEVVATTVTSDAAAAWLSELVRQAHAGGVALLRGELATLPNVDVREGEVHLSLLPVITQVLQEVTAELRAFLPDITLQRFRDGTTGIDVDELAASLRTRLPSDFGQVTVLRSSALPEAQRALRTLDRLAGGLVLLTVMLLAATIGTSRHRRRTVVQLGAGLVLGLVAAVLLARRLEGLVLDAISQPNSIEMAAALLGQLTNSLRSTVLLVIAAAIGAAALGFLVGRAARPTSTGEPAGGAASEDRTRDRRPRPPAAVATSRIGRDEP